MIFLADESIDADIVKSIRKEDHRVLFVAEMSTGLSDDAVLNLANQRGAILLTADKDFGELVFRQGRVHKGVILIRLFGMPEQIKSQIVVDAIRERGAKFKDSFTVISRNLTRIRSKIL